MYITSGIGCYGEFVAGLIRQSKPKIVLEVGLGEGASGAFAIITALLKNKEEGFGGRYYVVEQFPTKKGLETLNISKGIATLLVGDSKDPATYKLPSSADIVLIDGAHDVKSCYTDAFNILDNNLLTPGGIMIFHDIRMTSVRRAVAEINKEFSLNTLILDQEAFNICLCTMRN